MILTKVKRKSDSVYKTLGTSIILSSMSHTSLKITHLNKEFNTHYYLEHKDLWTKAYKDIHIYKDVIKTQKQTNLFTSSGFQLNGKRKL